VDIGGTNTRMGLFDSLDAPAFALVARFPTYQSYAEQLQQIIVAMQGCNNENLAGIGVSIAARIAKGGQSIVVAPNLSDYIDRPFAQDLVDRFNCPVRLAHDPVCGLLAEKKYGVLRDFDGDDLVNVGFVTGILIDLASQLVGTPAVHAPRLACLAGFDLAEAFKEQDAPGIAGTHSSNPARHLVGGILVQAIHMPPELLVAVLAGYRLVGMRQKKVEVEGAPE
jgi:hypothetical protein